MENTSGLRPFSTLTVGGPSDSAQRESIVLDLKKHFIEALDEDSCARAAKYFVENIASLYPTDQPPLKELLNTAAPYMHDMLCRQIAKNLERAAEKSTEPWLDLLIVTQTLGEPYNYVSLLKACSESLAALRVSDYPVWHYVVKMVSSEAWPLDFLDIAPIALHMANAGVEDIDLWMMFVERAVSGEFHGDVDGKKNYLELARSLMGADVICFAGKEAIRRHISSSDLLTEEQKLAAIKGVARVFDLDDEDVAERVETFRSRNEKTPHLWRTALDEAASLVFTEQNKVIRCTPFLANTGLIADPQCKGALERLLTSAAANAINGRVSKGTRLVYLLDACKACKLDTLTAELISFVLATSNGKDLEAFWLSKHLPECAELLVKHHAEQATLELLIEHTVPFLDNNLDYLESALKIANLPNHPAWRQLVKRLASKTRL